MKVTGRIKSSLQLFLQNEHRANFVICRAPARFLVLKGPILSQRVRWQQAGHFIV
jgi:hypothetical protein